MDVNSKWERKPAEDNTTYVTLFPVDRVRSLTGA